jgi:hypothetical protein
LLQKKEEKGKKLQKNRPQPQNLQKFSSAGPSAANLTVNKATYHYTTHKPKIKRKSKKRPSPTTELRLTLTVLLSIAGFGRPHREAPAFALCRGVLTIEPSADYFSGPCIFTIALSKVRVTGKDDPLAFLRPRHCHVVGELPVAVAREAGLPQRPLNTPCHALQLAAVSVLPSRGPSTFPSQSGFYLLCAAARQDK